MHNPIAVGIGAVSLAGAGLFGFLAQRYGRRSRLIGATEEVDLGKLRGGFVKVRGRVKFGPTTLEGPLSQKRCAYYRFDVHQLSGGRVKRWVRIFSDAKAVPFFLEDKSGKGRVDLAGAEVKLAAESGWGEDGEALPADMALKVRQLYGRDFQSFLATPTRYTEAVLEEDEKLFVVGTSQLGDDGKYVVKKADALCVASDEDEGALAYQANHAKFVSYFQAGAAALFGLLFLWMGLR
jgi:hypothetical protein